MRRLPAEASAQAGSRTADDFPATYFIILKAGLRFVTSLRSDKTGTSFSLLAGRSFSEG